MCVKQDREDMNQAATIKTEIVGGDTAEDKPFLYLLLLPVSSLHTHKALRINNNKTNQKNKKSKKRGANCTDLSKDNLVFGLL